MKGMQTMRNITTTRVLDAGTITVEGAEYGWEKCEFVEDPGLIEYQFPGGWDTYYRAVNVRRLGLSCDGAWGIEVHSAGDWSLATEDAMAYARTVLAAVEFADKLNAEDAR